LCFCVTDMQGLRGEMMIYTPMSL